MKLICKYSKVLTKSYSDNFCLYTSTDWDSIPQDLKRKDKKPQTIKVLGQNLPHQSDWKIQFDGEWKNHPKYGWEFIAQGHVLLQPDTKKGIEKYLCSSLFKGIGVKTAKAIVEKFGTETLKVIENEPSKLLCVKGITLEKAGTISQTHKSNIVLSELSIYLSKYGVGIKIATAIYQKYHDESMKKLKENPFIIQDIRGVGFKLCDKIARDEGIALDAFERVEGACYETLYSHCEYSGDIGEEYFQFEDEVYCLLEKTVLKDRIREVVKNLKNRDLLRCRGKKYILLKKYDDYEENVAKALVYSKSTICFKKEDIDKHLAKIQEGLPFKMADEQVDAIVNSLMSPVSIITGYAGTGKSTIMKAIIEIYKSLRPEDQITLMAPTGKAARRMVETTGIGATTIHRALGLYEGLESTTTDEINGLIIIDETSMIDIYVMDKLMKTCCNRNSHLVFLGDINQLPSVGVGCVLQSLIESGSVPVSRLTKVFRQNGGSIFNNCKKIIEGKNNLEYDDCFELVNVTNEEAAIETVKEIYIKEVEKYGIDQVALLTPLRRQNRYRCVSDYLNGVIQAAYNPNSEKKVKFNGEDFRVNDRVMQWKNHATTSNGDVGTIKDIVMTDDGAEVTIDWENGIQTVENQDTMDDINLAYSYSVHKSQGSEYKSVITVMLSSQIGPLHNRNLLYTDISRCKQHMTIVGDVNAINYCINNVTENKRLSLLKERIAYYENKNKEK